MQSMSKHSLALWMGARLQWGGCSEVDVEGPQGLNVTGARLTVAVARSEVVWF